MNWNQMEQFPVDFENKCKTEQFYFCAALRQLVADQDNVSIEG